MAEIFDVQYNIGVFSRDAVNGINSFVNAVNKLQGASEKLMQFQKSLASIEALGKQKIPLRIDASQALKKLEQVEQKINRIKNVASKGITLNVTGGVAGKAQQKAKTKQSPAYEPLPVIRQKRQTAKPQQPRPFVKSNAKVPLIPTNLEYQVLGPTRLGNVAMLDMFKGMGLMYGISAIGSGVRDIITTSVEYQNVMQTAKNILKANYRGSNFGSSFANMEAIARQVGVETKFTAPEVADAVKFLAMAGLDINAISQSIRPIADVALIGDTDLGTTADVMTNIMTGYDILPENMRKISDIMTRTFTMSNTTLMELAESFKMAAPLLNLNKVPFETAAAAFGVLGDAGIKGTMAGTTMRTIINNLMNPTKKQQKEWERLGISTKDENGNLRNLNDIFYELNERRLSGENVDIYKLFRLTAASGAGALMTHIDKWNEIIEQNFLSAGMSDKLAEAKKNQITGLMAQLRSAFQETGLQVFEENDGRIRSYLQKGINWLKGNEFKDALRNIIDLVMDLGKKLVEFTSFIFDLYKKFEPLIRLFLKFQLYLKMFQSVLGGIKQFGHSILYALTPGFNILSKTKWGSFGGFSNAYVAASGGTPMTMGMNPLLAWWVGGKPNAPLSPKVGGMAPFAPADVSSLDPNGMAFMGAPAQTKAFRDYNERLAQYQRQMRRFDRRMGMANRMNTYGGAAQVAGMFAGYQLGSLIDPTGNGAMIGSIAGSMALPLMMALPGAPIILGVAAALGVVVLGIRRYNENVNKAKSATDEWKNSMSDLGISKMDVTKPDAVLLKSIDIVSSRILDQNEKIQLQIQLWDRLAKAKKGQEEEDYTGTPLIDRPGMENVKKMVESTDAYWGKRKSFRELASALGFDATETKFFESEGRRYFADAERPFNAQAVFAAEEQSNYHVGEASKWLLNTIYKSSSPEEFQRYINEFWNQDFAPKIDDNKVVGTEKFSDVRDEALTYPSYGYVIKRREEELVQFYGNFLAVLEGIASGAANIDSLTQASLPDVVFMNAANGLFGSQQWINNIRNLATTQGWSNEYFREQIAGAYKQTLDLFNKLTPEVQPYYLRYLNKSVWESLMNGTNLEEFNGGFYAPTESNRFPFGEDVTWDAAKGYYIDKNGNPFIPGSHYNYSILNPQEDEQQVADTLLSYLPNISQEQYRPRERERYAQSNREVVINIYPGNMLNVENINGVSDPEELAEVSANMIFRKVMEMAKGISPVPNSFEA